MFLNPIISLISSIGACLTAIASFLVLIQNNKQRKESYKPQLVIKNTNFKSIKKLENNFFPEEWELSNSIFQNNQFFLPIVNIGLGAARQVKVSWIFNIETFITKINEETQKVFLSAYFEYKNNWLHMVSNSIPRMSFNWNTDSHQVIDYIIPISNDNESSEIIFPHTLIYLFNFYLYLFSKQTKKEEFTNFPKPIVQLSYLDIGNKLHKESFEINIQFNRMTNVNSSVNEIEGFIESKKINSNLKKQ